MLISPEVLRIHIDYTAWASARLVDAASQLTTDELTRDFGTADKTVLGTLVHAFAADRVWMARVAGDPPAKFIDPERDMHFAVLQNEWPPLMQKWHAWAASLASSTTGESAEAAVAWTDLKGNSFEMPAWQLVLHVVNHGTHHRGQVSGFLRAMGKVPPPLDLARYYREMNKSK
jgi:uncharacterized damage-inducible protein DinB